MLPHHCIDAPRPRRLCPSLLVPARAGSVRVSGLPRPSPSLVSLSRASRPQDLRRLQQLSISTTGVGTKPFSFGAKVSIRCTNENTHVEDLNLRSNRTEQLAEADEDVIPLKRSAKIHDFCLGIPFGGLLFCMGLLGYIFSRSTISLVLGVVPGLAMLFLGTLSLKFWRSGRSSLLFILGQTAISALLAWKYSQAYLLTNRILPWGFYASLSTAMACFYTYVLLAGGNPPPKKLAAAPSSS